MVSSEAWWEGAVIYQLIPRCFSDGNGDGIGDLKGLTKRLSYLRWLGIDAVKMTLASKNERLAHYGRGCHETSI